MNVSNDDDDIWFWHCHIANQSITDGLKIQYCRERGLDPKKFSNMKYLINYCSKTSPLRHSKMMRFVESFNNGDISPVEFAKKHKLNKSDFSTARRHYDLQKVIAKCISERRPVPDLNTIVPNPFLPEVEEDLSQQEVAITDDYALGRKRELLDKISIPGDGIQTLSEFIEAADSIKHEEPKVQFTHPTPGAHEAVAVPEPEPEPFRFVSVNPHLKGKLVSEPWSDKPLEIAPSVPTTPEDSSIVIKGDRIEFTFTKSVRVAIPQDLSQEKLTNLITLLKDL